MEERIDAYRVLMVKPEGRRPLGTRRQIREDNINMDFQQIVWEIGLIWSSIWDKWQAVVNRVTNCQGR